MIVYIHGFGSSGLGKKASILRKKYKDQVIAPTLSNIPKPAIDSLEQTIKLLLKFNQKVSLVGSSIGGYLSIYLANKYDLKAVLINPAIYPYKMKEIVGEAKSYFDNSYFECTFDHLETLREYEVLHVKKQENFMLLLQKNDEVFDYKIALLKLPKAKVLVEEGGSHGFENFESKLLKIEEFLGLKA